MTASLLVQTLLLSLLFYTYPYLFKKVLNLGSHTYSTEVSIDGSLRRKEFCRQCMNACAWLLFVQLFQ